MNKYVYAHVSYIIRIFHGAMYYETCLKAKHLRKSPNYKLWNIIPLCKNVGSNFIPVMIHMTFL